MFHISDAIEDHEYFGEVLLGIKHVIQNHLREVQINFQDRFQVLESELRQRDAVIDHLQYRIRELERVPSVQDDRLLRLGDGILPKIASNSSSSSSCETIFAVCPTFK